VEATERSFAFEIWDGTNWVEIGAMSTNSGDFSRYGSNHFLRSSTSEHIRYGIDADTTWATKTINSQTLYWSRVRITTGLTTAPVFEQFKLHSSRFEANSDGTNTFHGLSRFRKTLVGTGNVFGESGGVADFSRTIGTGALPASWSHPVKNSELGGPGDAIYIQFVIPYGTDTSQPLFVEAIYTLDNTGQTVDLICSCLPLRCAGVLVADPSGGATPVARTVANTTTLTAEAAQSDTTSGAGIDTTSSTKLYSLRFGPFDIQDFYEGDLVALRLELDADGGGVGTDVEVWALAVSGVLWTHGEKL
jgi:hypothetical protein